MTKEEYFEEAVTAFGDEKLDEAIESYMKALEIDPKYQDALHGLGMALFNRGRVDEAVATAKKLIEIDPADILAHTSLKAESKRLKKKEMQPGFWAGSRNFAGVRGLVNFLL